MIALLTALDGEDAEIVVLGGLVPEVLVGGQEPPAPGHLGTTDVDILLVSHLTLEGPDGFANQSLLLDPELDEAELRADAVAAIREFLNAVESGSTR